MNVAALNEIGITLCMAFGLAVFYFVGRKNARKRARGMEMEEEEGQPSSCTDAENPDKTPKEPPKGNL